MAGVRFRERDDGPTLGGFEVASVVVGCPSTVDSGPGSKDIRSFDFVLGAATGRRTRGPDSVTWSQLLLQPTESVSDRGFEG